MSYLVIAATILEKMAVDQKETAGDQGQDGS